ncbi:MAG: hypothetical protein K8S99_18065 [Planctomycetes bacterium]|nr:hypothetical protein [Planctomycetota bacterium]
MPVYLDDEPLPGQGNDLGAVLATAQQRLNAAGRVVVEVRIDGQTLNSRELDERGRELAHDTDVRLFSADPRDLASTVLESIRTELDKARESQAEAARLFQHDQPADAMRAVGNVIGVWQTAQQGLLHSTMLVGIDLDQRLFEERAVSEFLNDIIERIRQLRDLIESGDTVGLADTLGYEWPELTNRLDRLIAEIIGWIESAKR